MKTAVAGIVVVLLVVLSWQTFVQVDDPAISRRRVPVSDAVPVAVREASDLPEMMADSAPVLEPEPSRRQRSSSPRPEDETTERAEQVEASPLMKPGKTPVCEKTVVEELPVEVEIMQALGLEGDDVRSQIKDLTDHYRSTYERLAVEYRQHWADYSSVEPQENWPKFRQTSFVEHLQSQLNIAIEQFVASLEAVSGGHPKTPQMVNYLPRELN